MEKRDYYEVLGLNKNATEQEIKTAYRKLAIKFHPDKQAGKSESEKKDAEAKFKECSEAYEVLSNKEKRANYDQFGFDGPYISNGSPFNGFNVHEFMRQHSSMFGNMFSGMNDFEFGYNRNQTKDFNAPENGRHVQMQINISFKESMFGTNKEFELNTTEACPKCNGSGAKAGTSPHECHKCHGTGRIIHTQQNGFMIQQTISECNECNGSGIKFEQCQHCNGNKRIHVKKTIKVSIPQGVYSGQKLRIPNVGECGIKGGSNGDLLIYINVKENNIFERNGNDLYTTLWIDSLTATLGGTIKLNTPYKEVSINIPAYTENGKKFRLKNEGVKTVNNIGDLYAVVNIEPIADLNNEQKTLLNKIKETLTIKNFKQKLQYDEDFKNLMKN